MNKVFKLGKYIYIVIAEDKTNFLLERLENPTIWINCNKDDKELILIKG